MPTLKTLVDETSNIKNELVTCHTNLKNNLINKNIELTGQEKLLELVGVVEGIELGKKWATGILSNNLTLGETVSLPTLDFEPSIMILIAKTVYYYNSSSYEYEAEARNIAISNIFGGFEIVRSNLNYTGSISNVTSNGFEFNVTSNPTSRFSLRGLSWYAFE